ncbi:LacI family DNA-binding transcriptional regulator [Alloyangia pacifica]|uniref:LacI family DNA-binding transcriptional regulator n=1 Tax=Alloyangia pacifica TaxID=311180 RepID=UPI000B808235
MPRNARGQGLQRITNKALAKAARVSVSTVDRIMTGRSPVKRATVEHVLEIAEEVSFHGGGVIRSRLRTEAAHCRIELLLHARTRRTFLDMADRAQAIAESSHDVQARVITHHLTHPEPEATVAALVDLAQRCDRLSLHRPSVGSCRDRGSQPQGRPGAAGNFGPRLPCGARPG